MAGQIGVADCVQQVGLALARGALEVERRELRRLGRGHALCGIRRQYVAGAGYEAGEGLRGIDAGYALAKRGECVAIKRAGQRIGHAGALCGIVGGAAWAAAAAEAQFGELATPRVHQDAHMAHVRPGNLPREREPISKAVRNPVRRELGRQIQVEGSRLGAVVARLNRLDPLAVDLLTQVLAQALANVGPIGRQV